MSAPVVHPGLVEGRQLRDAGMAQAASARGAGWDMHVIDQAIRAMTLAGREWSANDLRELLPNVRQPLIGERIRAARSRKQIVHTGRYEPSNLPSTHAHEIKIWTAPTTEGQHA